MWSMLLNGYAVLGLFLCVARLVLAAVVLVVGLSVLRSLKHSSNTDKGQFLENRVSLLFLVSAVLIAMNFVSWPILYLLLQSYVQEWPAAMCIYGVTQIGAGSLGPSRFLPVLLNFLLWVKPVVIFAGGTSCVLYLINRRTQTSPILHRIIASLLLTGVVTVVDSVVESAYLTIPNNEIRLDGGCCTDTLEPVRQRSQFSPGILTDDDQRPLLHLTYYVLNLTMILQLLSRLTVFKQPVGVSWNFLLYVCGIFTVPASMFFLNEIAAPGILGLPFHHCPYDLITAAPESVMAVFLFAGGFFCLGWAFVAGMQRATCETAEASRTYLEKLLFLALFGYAGSLLLMSIELVLT